VISSPCLRCNDFLDSRRVWGPRKNTVEGGPCVSLHSQDLEWCELNRASTPSLWCQSICACRQFRCLWYQGTRWARRMWQMCLAVTHHSHHFYWLPPGPPSWPDCSLFLRTASPLGGLSLSCRTTFRWLCRDPLSSSLPQPSTKSPWKPWLVLIPEILLSKLHFKRRHKVCGSKACVCVYGNSFK
jgi:hypothetical protein